jgi:hypothetical protein
MDPTEYKVARCIKLDTKVPIQGCVKTPLPTKSAHSKCRVELGSPDPAVSTGLLHQLSFALSNFVGATVSAPCSYAAAATVAGLATSGSR